jgi:hypothetical protein
MFPTKADLAIEELALRQQLIVLKRRRPHPPLRYRDGLFWLWLARSWDRWRGSLIVVRPESVTRWHRMGFKYYHWAWKSRRKGGRPAVAREVRDLIRRMSRSDPLWGTPRIHGELLNLSIGSRHYKSRPRHCRNRDFICNDWQRGQDWSRDRQPSGRKPAGSRHDLGPDHRILTLLRVDEWSPPLVRCSFHRRLAASPYGAVYRQEASRPAHSCRFRPMASPVSGGYDAAAAAFPGP